MTREQILQEPELLEFDEERIKQQMRLGKLRLIRELQTFWFKKLQEL
jgi:hypothetical protein